VARATWERRHELSSRSSCFNRVSGDVEKRRAAKGITKECKTENAVPRQPSHCSCKDSLRRRGRTPRQSISASEDPSASLSRTGIAIESTQTSGNALRQPTHSGHRTALTIPCTHNADGQHNNGYSPEISPGREQTQLLIVFLVLHFGPSLALYWEKIEAGGFQAEVVFLRTGFCVGKRGRRNLARLARKDLANQHFHRTSSPLRETICSAGQTNQCGHNKAKQYHSI
jgi:hypothetical protein